MSHFYPGWARRNRLTPADIQRVAGELPDIHEEEDQPIQGGSPGEHFHLTAAQYAFIANLTENGIPFPEIRIYEPVAATEEILFSEESGDCLMAWGGEIQEINPETEGVISIPEGVTDARLTVSFFSASKIPGEGSSALDTTIFISNTTTGVVSPIPAGKTFTIRITCPALYVGDKVLTYTTPSGGTTSESVIASLLAGWSATGLGALGFSIAYAGINALRLQGPAATFVGRGLSIDGEWRLVESIAVAGSPGFAGNNKVMALEIDSAASYDVGEWLILTIGSYQFAHKILDGQTPAQMLASLSAQLNASGSDWGAGLYTAHKMTFNPVSGVYGTYPWVDYTAVPTIAPAE